MSAESRSAELGPNRLEVDLGAMRDNVVALRRFVGPGCDLFAALKSNAYGFGLVRTAHALAEAGLNAVAVSRIKDAIALREGGVSLPVLLYAGAVVTPELVAAIERFALTPTILDLAAAEVFTRNLTAERPVFVKVDVGQRRLGVEPRELAPFAAAVAATPKLRLEGIYTHMTVPQDPVPAGYVEQQFDVFMACLQEVEDLGLSIPVRMAASSAVLRLTDRMSLNAVDPGRIWFGGMPEAPAIGGLPLRSALGSLRSRLLQVKELDDDPRRPEPPVAVAPGMRLGVFALGTSDGLGAVAGSHVLVRGRRAPIIPAISLEHCRVDLSGIPAATAGDEVVVIGRQGDEEITIEEVVAHRGLRGSRYNIAIDIRESVPREYVA